MFCKKCGCENKDEAKFCKACGFGFSDGSRIEGQAGEAPIEGNLGIYGQEHVEGNVGTEGQSPVEGNNVSEGQAPVEGNMKLDGKVVFSKPNIKGGINKLRGNKKVLIPILAVVIILIGVIGYKLFSGDIKTSLVKKDIVGQSFGVGSMDVKVNEGDIKEVKIKSQKTTTEHGVKGCTVLGNLVLENEVYKVETPFSGTYIYNENQMLGEKGWMLVSFDFYSKKDEVKLDVKLKANEDVFKDSLVGKEIKTVKITEDMKKDIKVSNIEEKEEGTKATADISLVYDGKLISKEVSCKANIRLLDGKWQYVNINSAKTTTSVKSLDGDISLEDFVKDMSMVTEKYAFAASHKSMSTIASFSADQIVEVKNIKISEDSAYNQKRSIIDVDIKAVSGKATAEGHARIGLVEGRVSADIDFKADKVTVTEPSKEDAIAAIKDKTIAYSKDGNIIRYKLKEDEIKSFNMTEFIKTKPDPREYAVYGTMSYDGLKDDSIAMVLWYDAGKQAFNVRQIGSLSNEDFKKANSVEAVKEKISKYEEN